MLQTRVSLLLVAVCFALSIPLGSSRVALAHEHRQVGPIAMTVGWADEPTYTGFKNGVQLLLKEKTGKPITDLGDTLKVEVVFGSEKTGMLPLEPAFGKSYGTPGDYRAAIVPTRPGNYTFHFVGSVDGQTINESFTSSEKTFEPVQDPTEIEFPAKDPSAGELAARLDRLGPRIDAAQTAGRDAGGAASQSRTLAVVGIILGAVGIVMGFLPRRRQ